MELKVITGPYTTVAKAKEVDADVAAALEKVTEDNPLVVEVTSEEHGNTLVKAFRLAAKVKGRKILTRPVLTTDSVPALEIRQPRVREKKTDETAVEAPPEPKQGKGK